MAKGNKIGKGGFKDHPENINKNGPPKKDNTFKAILERELEKILYDKDGKRLGIAKDVLVTAWIKHAVMGGSIGHLRELLDRVDGKVPIPIKELSDDVIDLSELRDTLLEIQDVE